MDTTAFLSGPFYDTAFDPSLATSTGLTPLPTTSASPPAQVSMLHSVDSGIALDMDDVPQGRRSSSEEKDSLTPAQSRRKAQNRAAYVTARLFPAMIHTNRDL